MLSFFRAESLCGGPLVGLTMLVARIIIGFRAGNTVEPAALRGRVI